MFRIFMEDDASQREPSWQASYQVPRSLMPVALSTDQKVGVRVPPSAPRSQAPARFGEESFLCRWEPCWEPRQEVRVQTVPGSWKR